MATYCNTTKAFSTTKSNASVRKPSQTLLRGSQYHEIGVDFSLETLLVLAGCSFASSPDTGTPPTSFQGGGIAFISDYERDSLKAIDLALYLQAIRL